MDIPLSDNFVPTCAAFKAVQSASIQQLSELDQKELRTILPCISRAALCSTLDISDKFRLVMKELQRLMAGIEAVTSIVSLLSVDFAVIREDAMKEQQLRRKLGGNSLGESYLADSIENGSLLAEFERSEPFRRIRLVLSELLRLCSMTSEARSTSLDTVELFECAVYLQEVSDILCICFAELPGLLPLKDVAEGLLKVKYGPWLLCRLVGNAPDCFEQACISILSNATSSDENNINTQSRTKALKLLCAMNPSYIKSLRSEAMSRCQLPGLAIELSVSNGLEGCESDLVQFLSGILLTSDVKVKEWLAEYIRNAQKDAPNSSIYALRTQLIKDALAVVGDFSRLTEDQSDAMETDNQSLNSNFAKGIALIRLFCALKGMIGYKISNEESDAFLKLITCHPPASSDGVLFIAIGLSALLACTFVINNQERESQATKWIEWLCAHQADFGHNEAVGSSFGEMLLLIAIHFHGNNLEAIVDLVTTTLCMKLKLGSLTKMKILFTQQLFPEKIAAEHALTVPVTKNLNAKLTGFLPVHCVHQLLKSRVFSKHRVEVKDWIYAQICTSSAPLHPVMVPLIDAFVQSIIQPVQIGKTGKHHKSVNLDRFSEESVFRLFRKGAADVTLTCETTSQLLMLFYALLYQSCLLSNMSNLVNSSKRPTEYSADLYYQMPIKKLLLVSRENQNLYEDIYPPLLRLVIKSFPHLCLVEDYMFEEEIKEEKASSTFSLKSPGTLRRDKICTPDELSTALQNAGTKWPKAVLLLSKLSTLDSNDLVPFSDALVRSLTSLLQSSVPRKVQTLCCSIWCKLNTVIPRRIWLDTVNVLCCPQSSDTSLRNEPFTYEEIVKDPLIILRCDRPLFRCAPLFDIMLRILSAYMDASRAFLSHHIQSHPVPPAKRGMGTSGNSADIEREELKGALVAAQESAIVQILLEICLPTEEERQQSDNAAMHTLREIQCRVCSFLHQVFIADPNMVKLVHFQGYQAELLSVTVAGVPSMHISFDFIPELLNMPQLEKQLFAIQLLSYLSMQYPIPKSLSVAKHAMNRLVSLAVALPARKRTQFFLPVMPCLLRICTAFPPLREEASEILITLGSLTHTQLNKESSSSLRAGRISSSVMLSDDDESDDKGFQEEDMDCTAEMDRRSGSTTESDDNPRLKAEEQLSIDIERTFREIACKSTVGSILCDKQR